MSTRVFAHLQRTVVRRSFATASSRGRTARVVEAADTNKEDAEGLDLDRLTLSLQQHAQGPTISWTSPESDFIGQAFSSFDKNLDGQLDMQEVVDGAKQLGMNETEAAALFERMDVNGDGVVSRAEFSIALVNHAVNKSFSFASPESDFVSQHFRALDSNEDGVLSRDEVVSGAHVMGLSATEANALFEKMDVNGDGVVSKAEFSIAAADHSVGKALSFASPESDFSATRPEEQLREPSTFDWLLFPTTLSFTSPEADFCGPTLEELAVPVHLTPLSFATPEADFCAPTAAEIDVPAPAYETSLSFASPESDFCAPTAEHIRATERTSFFTQLSFASPESDFCAPSAEEMNRPVHQTTLSFATPEADFCASNHVEAEVPLTLTAAMAPTAEAVVITKASQPFEITHVNAAWTRLCGHTQEASAGKTLKMLQGPATERAMVDELVAGLLDGRASEIIVTNYDKSGRAFKNHLRAEPIYNDEGEVTHFLGLLREVDQRHASAVLK